jgi:hypothetical protein
LERGQGRGWGKVSIPADANPGDNEAYFAFDRPAPRRAVVVADDPQVGRVLRLAAAAAPEPSVECSAEAVAADHLASVDWESVSLLLWQGPLPEGDAARSVRALTGRGGSVVFFPPRDPEAGEFAGVKWTSWEDRPQGDSVGQWRGDQDLLANTQSGAALPLGQVEVRRACGLSGDFVTLASLRGGAPLLARAAAGSGGVYYCATTPAPSDSSLASEGVMLYVMTQRALAAGARSLEPTRELAAGDPAGEDPAGWSRVAGPDEAVSTEYALHNGVYESGGRLLAVNRPADEDVSPVLSGDQIAGLFRGLDLDRVDDSEGQSRALVQEVWRVFLVAMMAALVGEAVLCLPRAAPRRVASAERFPGGAA